MDNSQDDCGESRRRARSRPTPTAATFLDSFDKGCYALELDRQRIVLTPEFCAAFKKGDKSRSCGSNIVKPGRSCSGPPSATSVRAHSHYKPKLEGPFHPNKEFRHLAYQPIKAKKNLHRKISSNTLHGVDSVNDLRAWGFNKEERRQHYLEHMILGSGSAENEFEPAAAAETRAAPLLPYKETEAPIPVLRLKEQKENAEQGKTPAATISEQYHQQKTIEVSDRPKNEVPAASAQAPRVSKELKEVHGPAAASQRVSKELKEVPGPAASAPRVSKGLKEVQTPKLSITNLVEELNEDERNKLFSMLKKHHGDEDHNHEAAADEYAAELRKLNDHVKHLHGKHKNLQNGKDRLHEQHVQQQQQQQKKKSSQPEDIPHIDEQQQHKEKSLPLPEEIPQAEGRNMEKDEQELGDAIWASDMRGPEPEGAYEDLSDNEYLNDESEPELPEPRSGPGSREHRVSAPAPPQHQEQQQHRSSGPPCPVESSQPQSSDPCGCLLQLLKCQNAMLTHHAKELQCSLTAETNRVQQLLQELDGINTDYKQLHAAYIHLQSEATGPLRAIRTTEPQTGNPYTNENFLLTELNRTLEQELTQLREQTEAQNQRVEYLTLELERTKCEAGRHLEETVLLEREIDRLGTQLCQLCAENEKLKSTLENMAASGGQRLEQLEAENQALREEINMLRSQTLQLAQDEEIIECEQATNTQVLEQNKVLQQEMVQLMDQIRQLRADNDMLQPALAELEHTMLDKAELLGLNNCLQQEICQLRNQTHSRSR